jgi:ATP-binding cassette subfamily B protein/subfamily B ATP-binding cassette protein MsbA
MNIYRRVAEYYRSFGTWIFAALLIMVVSIGFNALKPWPMKWLIDDILPQTSVGVVHWHGIDFSIPEAITAACVVYILTFLLHGATSVANNYLLIRIGLDALLRVRTQLYSYLQYLPLHFHDRRRSGDSTFRVAYDSQAIQTFFNRGFATILSSVLTLIITLVLMFRMNPTLAFVSLAVIPFLWGSIFLFAKKIRNESARLQQEESDVLSRAQEGLTSIRIVHAFGREEFEVQEFEKEARHSYDANLQLTLTNVFSSLVVGLVTAIGAAGILYLGAHEVVNGNLKVGDLWVFLAYLTSLYAPLEQLSYTAWSLEGAAAGMQRVFEILDAEDSVPENKNAKVMQRPQGKIAFDSVHFGYDADHPILKGLSFEVQPGETVAVVGGTGAGKTTLLSLIPRFYDPSQGRVLIDGEDIRGFSKKSVRSHQAIVLQDTLLLSGTIEENIAYGRPGATTAEIIAAAKEAQAFDFISKLPQGLKTSVGERGVRLSGGQKQRIGIARAFLKKAPILLLDEPTSALDLETESEIMETLKRLVQLQTTLIITHRLSTIHHLAHRIIVLENGQMVESGRGEDLLKTGGLYARLWKAGKGE